MLHIYILTSISEESKALCTVNTWLRLASCHLRNQGQVNDRCVCSLQRQKGKSGTEDIHGDQFYNMIFRYQLLSAFSLNLIPMGGTLLMLKWTADSEVD